MNRRTIITATATAAVLAATLTACKPAPGSDTTAANAQAATRSSKPAAAACTVEYGPNQAGIYAKAHDVDASVYLNCNSHPDNAMVSLTLAYAPPGTSPANDQEAQGATYNTHDSTYTATAPCQPGSYALHVLYSANVNGQYVSDQGWGKTADITAADCNRG